VKRFVLERTAVDRAEVGDVLIERGPRIGLRRWLVVDVHRKRIYDHAFCMPDDGTADGKSWTLTRGCQL
jgi:hypothetical protein